MVLDLSCRMPILREGQFTRRGMMRGPMSWKPAGFCRVLRANTPGQACGRGRGASKLVGLCRVLHAGRPGHCLQAGIKMG